MKAKGKTWSRKGLVLALANQDGGAHVDIALDEDYHHLSRLNLFAVHYVDDRGISEAVGNPAAAAVRQITYELLDSFDRDQPNVDPDAVLSPHLGEASGEAHGARVLLGQWPVTPT